MKTALIISGIISTFGAVSAFTWVPDAFIATRDVMIEPALVAGKETEARIMDAMQKHSDLQTIIMAGMKHYDIRTDELADDCRKLQNRINEAKKELEITTDQGARRYIQRQINNDETDLEKKQQMLDEATSNDRQILAGLARGTA